MIAGAALGLEQDDGAFIGVLIAILAHKGTAAFSMIAALRDGGVTRPVIMRTLAGFSLTTPVAILLGSLYAAAEGRTATITEAVFDGLAAGTFLYIASWRSSPACSGRAARMARRRP